MGLCSMAAQVAAAAYIHRAMVITTIGYGSPNKANPHSVHGSALGAKEVEVTRLNPGWPFEPFHVLEDVKRYSRYEKRSKLLGWILPHLWDAHLNLSTDMALHIAREILRKRAQPYDKAVASGKKTLLS